MVQAYAPDQNSRSQHSALTHTITGHKQGARALGHATMHARTHAPANGAAWFNSCRGPPVAWAINFVSTCDMTVATTAAVAHMAPA